MIEFIRQLFSKKVINQTDEVIYIENCERWISIHDPKISRPDYDLILVDARKILAWANRQKRDVYGGSKSDQAARGFLPEWLRTIPKGSNQIARPEPNLNRLLFSGLDYFDQHGWTKYWCDTCGSWDSESIHLTENRESLPFTIIWDSVIKCSKGHELIRRNRVIKYHAASD